MSHLFELAISANGTARQINLEEREYLKIAHVVKHSIRAVGNSLTPRVVHISAPLLEAVSLGGNITSTKYLL